MHSKVSADRPTVVCVLGMHRSGTSLATRMVQACGFQVPGQALSATGDNPEGYSEPRALVRANNRILAELNRHWSDDRPVEGRARQQVFDRWQRRVKRLVGLWLRHNPRLVLKDPRLCLTFPVWRDAALAHRVDLRVLLVQRDASEVARSLAARAKVPAFRPAAIVQPERSDLLWWRHVLWAERYSRGLNRQQQTYQQMLAGHLDPMKALLRPWWPDDDAPCALVRNAARAGNTAIADAAQAELGQDLLGLADREARFDQLRNAFMQVQQRFASLRYRLPPPEQPDLYAPQLLRAYQHACLAPEHLTGHVIFLSGAPGSRGHIYRVEHSARSVRERGMRVDVVSAAEHVALAPDTRAVVMFRTRADAHLNDLVLRCKRSAVPLIYDIDDAVFDSKLMTPRYFDYMRVRSDQALQWVEGAPLYAHAMQQCDAVIVTTQPLAARAASVHQQVKVVPNGLAPDRLALMPRDQADELIRIGYASGTPTHQKDFAEVAQALAAVLARYPTARLCVLGHLDLGEFPELEAVHGQIEQRPLVDFDVLPAELARFDINLAPLQRDNPFCDCKSELKYFEAAAVGVTTIASATPPMCDAIIEGQTGFIARDSGQWQRLLIQLIEQPALRRDCARRARAHALACYGPEARGEWFVSVFSALLRDITQRRGGRAQS